MLMVYIADIVSYCDWSYEIQEENSQTLTSFTLKETKPLRH